MKKKVQRDGHWVWEKPVFAKTVTHSLPDGTELKVKAGTQVIDRFWRDLRGHLEGVSSKVGSETLRRRIRSAQWVYWMRGHDLWEKTGEMLKDVMARRE